MEENQLKRVILPFHFYELQKSGLSEKQIANLFDVSPDRVQKELAKHPLNMNLRKIESLSRYPSELDLGLCRQTSFKCHPYIIDTIDLISGTNRRSKVIEAIEHYLELGSKPIASVKPSTKDPNYSFYVPVPLLEELESLPSTKSRHILAALELFIVKYLN